MTAADCQALYAQTVIGDATMFAWPCTFGVRDCDGLGLDGLQ